MNTQARYTFNGTAKPLISHDNGFLDKFPKRAPTKADYAKYLAWSSAAEGVEAVQGVPFMPKNDLPDGIAAYRHFLRASGTKRTISIDRYFANDSSGATMLKNCVIEAKAAAYKLYQANRKGMDADFVFAGSLLGSGSSSLLFPYPATENWQKAIGGFSFWITGDVEVDNSGAQPKFDLIFTVHVEDMYNFNPGQKDLASGIPDSANGLFEITGLGKQYINEGTASRKVTWTGAPRNMQHTLTASNGRRVRRSRQPQDNRRIRNRL